VAYLERLLHDQERVAVLLFDSERARLFTVHLGEIEDRTSLFDAVARKQATGGWFGLQQTQFARQREQQVSHHASRTIAALSGMLRDHPFDRLLLGGPAEPVALLRAALPRSLRSRIAGTVKTELFASEAEVLRAVLPQLEALERAHELHLVHEVLEAATSKQAAIGPEPTFEALSEGRAHQVFLGAAGAGARCAQCDRLTVNDRCPSCGGAVQPVADLDEHILRQALAQGAQIEFVGGEAAQALAPHGGLAAWTRY
jgi:peptide subunit release factor 1 (eRF1)